MTEAEAILLLELALKHLPELATKIAALWAGGHFDADTAVTVEKILPEASKSGAWLKQIRDAAAGVSP